MPVKAFQGFGVALKFDDGLPQCMCQIRSKTNLMLRWQNFNENWGVLVQRCQKVSRKSCGTNSRAVEVMITKKSLY